MTLMKVKTVQISTKLTLRSFQHTCNQMTTPKPREEKLDKKCLRD